MAILLGLTAAAYWALHNSNVQTFLVNKFISQLTEKLNADISIGKVKAAYFNKVILEDVLLEDQKADTLFYAHTITASIDSLKPRKKTAHLNRLVLSNSKFKTDRDSTGEFSFNFIAEALQAPENQTGKWRIHCRNFNFFSPKSTFHDHFDLNKLIFPIFRCWKTRFILKLTN